MNRHATLTRLCILVTHVGSIRFHSDVTHDCFCHTELDEMHYDCDETVIKFIENAVEDAMTAYLQSKE